jgi:hypothetical protein
VLKVAAVNHALRNLNWTLNALLALVLSMVAVIIYWAFEPDPLTVNYAKGYTSWSLCSERRYSLVRDVQSRKDLTVNIKEYWWDIDGMQDVGGKMHEYPHKPLTTYTLSAGTDRVFDFPKYVPKDLPVGRYRYRPHAEYQINPIKTIRRDLPVQYVNVVCDYDPQKHGVME